MNNNLLLEKLYKRKDALDKALKMADRYEKSSDRISDEVNDLVDSYLGSRNIKREEVRSLHNLSSCDTYYLSKMWNIYLASTVNVKRTVRLHDSYAVSPLFGLKYIRHHSSIGVFRRFSNSSDLMYPRLTEEKILESSGSSVLDLKRLFSNNHIDQGKVTRLYKLTDDVCSLYKEYKKLGSSNLKEVVDTLSVSHYKYNIDIHKIAQYCDRYLNVLSRYNVLEERKEKLENHWLDINRNYMLIHKLTSSKLRA